MKKHKWIPEQEYEYGTKPHVCKKCGIRKKWCGGEDQHWEYRWNESFPAQGGGIFITTEETYKRPDCK